MAELRGVEDVIENKNSIVMNVQDKLEDAVKGIPSLKDAAKDTVEQVKDNKDTEQAPSDKGTGNDDKKPCANIAEFKAKYGDLIIRYAKELGVDPNILGAIVFTESGGGGFYPNGTLKIRFEEHIFYSKWAGTAGKYKDYFIHSATNYDLEGYRTTLDSPWQKTHIGGKQHISEYGAFEFAKTLDEKSAYNAISMGFGQVMGFNHKAFGYNSAKEMFDDFSKSEEAQIVGMMNFIKHNSNCTDALKKQDLNAFGLSYNGSGNYGAKVKNNIKVYQNAQ